MKTRRQVGATMSVKCTLSIAFARRHMYSTYRSSQPSARWIREIQTIATVARFVTIINCVWAFFVGLVGSFVPSPNSVSDIPPNSQCEFSSYNDRTRFFLLFDLLCVLFFLLLLFSRLRSVHHRNVWSQWLNIQLSDFNYKIIFLLKKIYIRDL